MQKLRYACAALVLVAGCDATRNSPHPLGTKATFDLYVVSPTNTEGSREVTDPLTNTPVFLKTPAIISAADVATVQRSEDLLRQPSLTVTLTQAGGEKVAAATAMPGGMRIAMVVNGDVVCVANVVSPLSAVLPIAGPGITEHREKLFDALTKN